MQALVPYESGVVPVKDVHLKKSMKKSGPPQKQNFATVGIDSGLAIFKPQQFEGGIKREVTVDYHALASIQKNKCIEFIIPKSNLLYFALNKSVLRIKFRIIHVDGTDPDKTDKVTCCQAAGTSLFRQVDIELQQKLISSEIGIHYAFKAYFDYIIFSPAEYLESAAQTNLFFKDTAYKFNKTDLDGAGANLGLVSRHEFTKGGAQVSIISPIAHDLMQINEFLPSGMEMKFRFWPNSDEFFVISGETTEQYKYEIDDVILTMVGFELGESVLMRHNQILSKTNAQFHYKKSVLKSYQIPSDLKTWTIFQFLQNEIPCDLIIAFIDAESFVGSQSTNPYECSHHNLNFLSLETEGYQTMTFRPDYSQNQWAREYDALYNHEPAISLSPLVKYRDFPGGYAIYRFPLGNEQVERLLRQKKGQSRLVINFEKSLSKALTVLVYARFHDHLEVDFARNVYLGNECAW